MLKGRTDGQRQTETHTDRQSQLKIMVLHVCNRAKRIFKNQSAFGEVMGKFSGTFLSQWPVFFILPLTAIHLKLTHIGY